MQSIGAAALHAAVTLRDLTDPAQGPHAMQQIVADVVDRLRSAWACQVVTHHASPIATVADNYDRLHYAPDGIARDQRYTRYITPSLLLRTQTSAVIPGLLRTIAGACVRDVLLVCPGLVYRRDCIDRLHTGEPHQVDLWRLHDGRSATVEDLEAMIQHVVEACVPDAEDWRAEPAEHPYTRAGRQIEVRLGREWIEIGECGLASARVIDEAGLPSTVGGLAMGLGLDRLLMLRKGIPDIRLLRSADPRVMAQMLDLAPYRPVSGQPSVVRDMSLAVPHYDTVEELGDRVRVLLGDDHSSIEELRVLSETKYEDLPAAAIKRMGIGPHQKNVLVRLVIRHLDRSLTAKEANDLRDKIYLHLHQGAENELSPAARTDKGS